LQSDHLDDEGDLQNTWIKGLLLYGMLVTNPPAVFPEEPRQRGHHW
jgi:hypothetical protein